MPVKHESVMVKEMEKGKPNLVVLKDFMERTSTSRAEAMENMETGKVLDKFPYLRIPSLLQLEMEFRCGSSPLLNMSQNISKHAKELMRTAPKSPLKALLLSAMNQQLTDELKTDYRILAALILLPTVFKEHQELLFTFNEKVAGPTPILQLTGPKGEHPTHVVMDGGAITKNAVTTIMSAYIVYIQNRVS